MRCAYVVSDMLLHVDPVVMGHLQGETPTDLAEKGDNVNVAHVLKRIDG